MANSLKIQVILAAIDKVSGPFKGIDDKSKSLRKSLKNSRDSLKELERAQDNITGFRKLKNELSGTQGQLGKTQQRIRQLTREQKSAGNHSKTYIATIAKLKREATSLKTISHQQRQKLQVLRGTLQSAGIDTRRMADHQIKLKRNIASASTDIDRQKNKLDALGKAQQRMYATKATSEKLHRGGMVAVGHGAGALYAGMRATRAAMGPVAAAVEFESSMADVRKVVDGLEKPEAFKAMSDEILALSERLPMAANEIAQITAAAGQAGIARNELAQFTEDAVKMGVAFDTTADEAGKTMATWRTAFRLNQTEVVKLADQVNYLGNTGAASVDKISAIITRVGALGEVAGLSGGPIAALGSTIGGMGVEDEVAATGIKNMLLALTAGEAATKKQQTAFQALGLNAKKMAKAMQTDAPAAIVKVLEQLRKLPPEIRAARMTQLFGRESVGAIAPLLNNLELLQTNFAKVSDEAQYGGSMNKEYASRAATTANALQLLKNKANVLAVDLGSTLLPEMVSLANRAGDWIKHLREWAQQHPNLSNGIVKLAIGGSILLAALGALLVAGGTTVMMFAQLQKGVMLLSGGSGFAGMINSAGGVIGKLFMPLVNLMRMLLPAVLGVSAPVVAAIVAIAAAALLIWKYWEPIKTFLVGVRNGFIVAMQPVMDMLAVAFEPLRPVFDWLGDTFGQLVNWLKDFLPPMDATNAQLATAVSWGLQLGQVIGGVLATAIRTIILVLGVLWQALKLAFNWSPLGLIINNWDAIGSYFSTLWDNIKLQVGSAWNFITGIFSGDRGKIISGLQGMWQAINGILGSWPAKMLQAGMDMLQGLIDGITSKIPGARTAISAVGNAIRSVFTGPRQMDIRSPSRTFARYGGHIMTGLSGGLFDGQNGPLSAMRRFGEQFRRVGAGLAVTGALGAPAVAFDQRPPLAPPTTYGGGGNTYQIHVTVTGGAVASDIGRTVREEIERIERERSARHRSRLSDD